MVLSPQHPGTIPEDAQQQVTQNVDSAFQESSGPQIKSLCESETLLKATASSEVVHATTGGDPKLGKEDERNDSSQTQGTETGGTSEETEGDDDLKKDEYGTESGDDTESDSEVI